MSLYNELNLFLEGKSDAFSIKLADEDRVVSIDTENTKNPFKSIAVLTFSESEYAELFAEPNARDNNNEYYIRVAFNNYGRSPVFIDTYYYGDEEWKEGYIIGNFNEENKKKVVQILNRLAPHMSEEYWGDVNSDINREVSQLLNEHFSDEVEQIAYDYSIEYDNALVKGLKDYIVHNICNKFFYINIFEKDCAHKYITTVGNLIDLYDNYAKDKNDAILKVLKDYINDENLWLEYDLGEDYYDYYHHENFDDVTFQRDVERQLNKIIDKIDEDIDDDVLKKHVELYNFIKQKGYAFGKFYNFPEEKTFGKDTNNNMFRFDKLENGKVNVLYRISSSRFYNTTNFKLDIEQLKNFLYHPELFSDEN
jgi:hypothetical protein